MKIYIADDDPDDLYVFQEIISRIDENIDIDTSIGGQELLDKITTEHAVKPDMIFLDINMPRFNGMDALRAIRNLEKFNNTPVLMISTSTHSAITELAFECGADMYIVKPNEFNDYERTMIQVLGIDWLERRKHLGSNILFKHND